MSQTPENEPTATPSSEPPPPAPPNAQAATDAAKALGGYAKSFGDRFRREAWLCIRRVIRSDFQVEKVTPEERDRLAAASPPINDPITQDYAGWRKSVLFISAFMLLVYAGLQIIGFRTVEEQTRNAMRVQYRAMEKAGQPTNGMSESEFVSAQMDAQIAQFGRGNMELLDGITGSIVISSVLGAAAAFYAARKWSNVRTSRRWSRAAWLVMFATPFLVTAIPVTAIMDFSHLDSASREQISRAVGVLFSLQVFMMIGPKAIALFPGLIRASMTLKTLLPESPAPGWYAALVAPLYAVFLLVLSTSINQAYGDFLLISGILALILGALVFVIRAPVLIRSHKPAEVGTQIRGIRQTSAGLNALGAVLIGSFVFTIPDLSLLDALNFLVGLIGNVLLLTIVASDFVLALLAQSHAQSLRFVGTDAEHNLSEKLATLGSAGFTELHRGAPRVAAPSPAG